MRRKRQIYHNRCRTYQERRANQPDEDGVVWHRAKRAPVKLDPWKNERNHNLQKSWKLRRATRYYPVGEKPQKHEFNTTCRSQVWKLVNYLCDHNITYRRIVKSETRVDNQVITTERKGIYNVPNFGHDGIQRGYKTVYYDYPLEKPIVIQHTYRVVTGYVVFWWSNSPIDVEKIVSSET